MNRSVMKWLMLAVGAGAAFGVSAQEAEVMVEAAAEVASGISTAELAYALDTFYFLVSGAFVMWMAAGFSMLEAGLVRSKNTVEILTKNVALFATACIMYLLIGYNFMYTEAGMYFPGLDLILSMEDHAADVVNAGGVLLKPVGLLLPGGVRGNGHVHRLGRGGRAHEAVGIPWLRRDHDRVHLPDSGHVELGRRLPG